MPPKEKEKPYARGTPPYWAQKIEQNETLFAEWNACLGLPEEIEPLPSFLTAAPRRDGITHPRPPRDETDACLDYGVTSETTADKAARYLSDMDATQQGLAELQEVLWSGLLNPQEQAVFELYCDGHGRRVIAKMLGITVETVRWKIEKINNRFGLRFRFGRERLTPHCPPK